MIFQSVFFQSEQKIFILSKNVRMQIFRTFSREQFCIEMFLRILYSLAKNWIFFIDIFQVSKYYNFSNFGFIEKILWGQFLKLSENYPKLL